LRFQRGRRTEDGRQRSDDGCQTSDIRHLASGFSLQQAVYIRRFLAEDADGAHLLQNAVEGLLGGSGAGLGFGLDLPEFGVDEVLSREDAVARAGGDALDGGGDAFVPGHGEKIKGRGSRVEWKAPSVQPPSSREAPNRKCRAVGVWTLEFLWCLVLGIWMFPPLPLDTRHWRPGVVKSGRASTDYWPSGELFRHRFA
jgi:hypothetical protein